MFFDMRFISQIKIGAMVLLGMLSVSCTGAANNDSAKQSLPVFVHPDVNVAAYLPSDESNISLSAQLTARWVLSVDMQAEHVKTPSAVDSCQSALKADVSGAEPSVPSMYVTFQYAVAQCRAVFLASRLTSAEKSFLNNFSLNESGIQALPIALLFKASTVEKAKLEQQFTRIGEAAVIKDISKTDEYEVSYSVGSGQQALKLLGRGDLNGDNIEDLILQVTNSVEDGSYRTTELFVLTRVSDNSGVKILELGE
ncbi:MAG: hypothetical protein K6L76_04950 [Agarilytica sp.]